MTNDSVASIRGTASINILAGLWLFVSPWVYRAYMQPNAWNSWIVGALIVLFAATRMSNSESMSSRGTSVANIVLGIWTFISPWVYGYTGDTGRFINSLCVGLIVFIVGVIASSMGRMATPPPLHS